VAREEIFGPVAAGAFLTMGRHGAVGAGMGMEPRGGAWRVDPAQRRRHQTGEGRELTGGPTTVLSGAGLKWFKPFSNSNGSKTLKKIKL
jgi:hypothetical protein